VIEDVASLKELLPTAGAELIRVKMSPTDGVGALKIKKGLLIVRDGMALPVVDGKTSTKLFVDLNQDKHGDILAAPSASTGAIANALFMKGSPNYYHFLAFNLPTLIFLKVLAAKGRVTLVTAQGFPKSATTLMDTLLPSMADNCPVEVRRIDDGTYDLADVIVPIKPPTAIVVALNRGLVMPFVMAQAGVTDPLRELGPVKLFVRREQAVNGRNLSNQPEVEAWFVARGYTSVNPGSLTMAEQVLLFSRATHIAGVEGAAFANILFAVNAVHMVMISSPAVRDEKFFSSLAKHSNVTFERLFGDAASPKRNADFTLPMQSLEGLPEGV